MSRQLGKAERLLGVNDRAPLEHQLAWLRDNRPTGRTSSVRSKALQILGATVQDLQVEKALIVLGEAPGREIPGGPLPRKLHQTGAKISRMSMMWAVCR